MSKLSLGMNIAALQGQRQLARHSEELSSISEKLASGQRITRASDDAAGLAVRESLNEKKRVLTQAVRNANDGISALTIADSTLDNMKQITTRIKELATQSANGVLSLEQRRSIDAEATALTEEYNRIVESAEFNGRRLFEDGTVNFTIQAGYGSDGTIGVSLGQDLVTYSSSLGEKIFDSGYAEISQIDFDAANRPEETYLQLPDAYEGALNEFYTFYVSSGYTGFEDGSYFTLHNSTTDFYFWYNVDGSNGDPGSGEPSLSGYTGYEIAACDTNTTPELMAQATYDALESSGAFGLVLNGAEIEVTQELAGDYNSPNTFGSFIDLSISESNGNLGSYQSDSYIQAYQPGLGSYYVWFNVNGQGSDPSPGGTGYQIDLSAYTGSGDSSSEVVDLISSAFESFGFSTTIGSGDMYLYACYGGNVNNSNSNNISGSFSMSTNDGGIELGNGDYAEFESNGAQYYVWYNKGGGFDPGLGDAIPIEVGFNGTDGGDLVASATDSAISSSAADVSISLNAGVMTITNDFIGAAADINGNFTESQGRQAVVSVIQQGSDPLLDAALDTITVASHRLQTGDIMQITTGGTLPGGLAADTEYYVIAVDSDTIKLAASAADAASGTAIDLSSLGSGEHTLQGLSTRSGSVIIDAPDLTAVERAKAAISNMDNLLEVLNREHGAIGASQSRLMVASNVLQTAVENYAAAESRISDIDVAEAAARLVKTDILQQVSAAVLGQANQQPALALTLLRTV